MHLETADQVWARIAEHARAAKAEGTRGAVATDGDGTLWSGDVGDDLFHAFVERGPVMPPGLEAMRREARNHAISDAGSGPDVARRIFAAFQEGRFPEERVYELMTWCFAGWTESQMGAFARETVARVGLPGRLHLEVLQVLTRARDAGLEVILVSASPVAVVKAAGASAGFDEAHIVAAHPRYEGGVMVAEVDRPIPYHAGKVTRLREHLGTRCSLLAAFGDNAFDLEMLASARVGVAVRPKPRLRERANELAGLVELAPAS